MKKSTIVKSSMVAILAVLLTLPAFAWKLGGKEMVQNGYGQRTKAILGAVYNATLFVPQELKGAGDTQIIDADQPMSMSINITSGMITKDKFVSAVSEGFDKAAGAGYGADKQAYINLYNNVTITKGDTFSNHYAGGKLLVVHSTGGKNVTLGELKGLQFKKAFFAIFIGPKPVQDSLKKGLLGK